MRLSDTSRLVTRKAQPLSDFARLMRQLNIDGPLLVALLLICGFGLAVLYSAVGESGRLTLNQLIRLGVALVGMLIVAQFPQVLVHIETLGKSHFVLLGPGGPHRDHLFVLAWIRR